MTEYDVKAKEFLKKYGAKMKISHVFDEWGGYHKGKITDGWLYIVRIDRNGKSWSFQFSDSVYNRQHNERPTPYDVLACIVKYEPYGDMWDFAKEFGFEIYDRESYKKTERTFKAVCKEYKNVIRMFGDCIDELREIQ